MKKRLYFYLFITFILTVSISSIFFIKYKLFNKTVTDLINISELSEDFMNNYFEEISEIEDSDSENILIVISKEKIENTYGAKKVIDSPNNQYILIYDNLESKNNAYKKLKEDSSITVDENTIYTLSSQASSYYNSWGVEKMGLDSAINFVNSKSLNDVTVAIIDTGCDMDLFNQNYSGKIKETYNVLSPGSDMVDEDGHGTHIAGTIAESTPNNVKILPIKVSTSKNISIVNITAAINYIVYNNSADVINMSFSSEGTNNSLYQAIQSAFEKNIISVAASGNDNTFKKNYPAAHENTIAISSVDSSLNKSTFSNYGSYITFSAPGTDIKSINGVKSGTSMATPHAVSAVAILKSFNKNLTMDDTIELLKVYAKDLGDEGWDNYFGNGFISFENTKFCGSDNYECDEYDVFSQSSTQISKIEVSNPQITEYNYGSINNLFPSKVKIYYKDGRNITKTMGNLEDIEIKNYDPYSKTSQTVTFKYNDITTNFNITNPDFKENGWDYNIIDSNNVELTHYKSNGQKYIYLYFPETIDGHTVVSLADSKSNEKSDMFDETSDFEYFKTIVLPKTISKIGKNVFRAKETLNNNPKSSLINLITNNEEIEVGDNAFMNNYELTTFRGTISKIGAQAFSSCTSLNNIRLSEKIDRIENSAFSNCTSLEYINIPNNVTYIGPSAFSGINIENMVIPEGVTTIETNTFFNCKNLRSITLPDSITQIGDMAFTGSGIESIIVPKNVTEIKNSVFYSCNSLKEVYLPRNVITINNNAFNKNLSGEKLDLTIYTYTDAYAKTYAKDNKINYETINPENLVITVNKNNYKAFEQVKNEDISLIQFDYERGYTQDSTYKEELITKTIDDGYTIKYIDDNDSFRFDDDYYKLDIEDKYNELYENVVYVTISKAVPIYNKPNNLEAKIGMKLSDITLPDGFEWMDESQTITTSGAQIFKAKFIPDDTINYETVENIEITVNVVEPKITINSKSLSPTTIYNNTSGEVTFNVVTKNIEDGTNLTVKVKKGEEDTTGFSVSGNTVNANKATIVVKTPSNIEMDNDTGYTVEISSGSTKATGGFTIKKYIYVNEIRVNKDNLVMNIGDIKDIAVEVLPDNAVSKEYDVEEGYNTNTVNIEKSSNKITVTAKNLGNTTIKLKAKDGSETEKSINVSVNEIKLKLNATIGDSPYTSGNLTNKEVKVTLSVENIEEENVIYKYSDDNKSSWKDYTNETKFKNINKEIYFKAVDSEGRESNIVAVHINSDMIAPELKVSYKKYKEVTTSTELIDTTKIFDSRISLYLKSEDTSGSLKYQLDDETEKIITGETINCDTCNTIDLTKNKTYRLKVTLSDKAGNKIEKTYNLTIDNNVYNIDVKINNGKYKGSGTYENQDNFKSTVNTREGEARFKISPNVYYEYKGSNITCDKEGVTTSYSNEIMILKNYGDIEDDMKCTITFEEIDYETKIEIDEHGSIEEIKEDKITQKHSDSKKYTLKQDRGYIYKSFICDNANVSYNREDSSVTISEVRDNGTCTYETMSEENDAPTIDDVIPYVANETKDKYETNKWVNKKVKIDIEASNNRSGVGIKEILYKTSRDREWKLYTEDMEFENINDTIYFKVIDYSDKESAEYSIVVKSDTVVPSTPKISSILDETNVVYTPNTFTNKKINIILESIDEMSGIGKYQYKIGNKKVSLLNNKFPQVKMMASETEWKDVIDNKITIGDVTDVVYFRAIDNAGNVSEVSSIEINSDTTKVFGNDKQNPEPNPQTGINIPLISLFVILISGISILIYTRKNNKFPNV